jgi:uncharacterized protein YcbX
MPVVTQLLCYPVKGCAGTSLRGAAMTATGLAHDRTFMVTDTDGRFRSQRRDPRLAVIRPRIEDNGRRLVLAAPDAPELAVEVDTGSPSREVELFGQPCRGIDQGQPAARWLSQVLGDGSRLVRMPPEEYRVTAGSTPGACAFADSGAVLMLSPASLDGLNARIGGRGGDPVPLNRFRANVIVGGWDEPHTEDLVRRVRIGTAELAYAKLAIRCSVVQVDQRTGAAAGPEPLRTLADYRRAGVGGVAFGSKFSVLRAGDLAVGDEVRIDAWGACEL